MLPVAAQLYRDVMKNLPVSKIMTRPLVTVSPDEALDKATALMEQRGNLRGQDQTPLEFADKLKSSEALVITRAYNRVRFGGERLSPADQREVERALFALEVTEYQG